MPLPVHLDVSLATGVDEALLVQGQIVEWLKERHYSSSDVFGVRLSLEEGLMNAIKHGNHSDSSKRVRVHCDLNDQRVLIEIEDDGAGFDPGQIPDPLADENLEKPSGRGVYLMRQYMTRVEYRQGGRLLVMEKHRSSR